VVFPLLHEYLYPPEPPDAVTEALPFLPPPQVTFVCVKVKLIGAGSVILADAVPIQPALSVTTHVYVPAVRLLATALVPPDGAHENT